MTCCCSKPLPHRRSLHAKWMLLAAGRRCSCRAADVTRAAFWLCTDLQAALQEDAHLQHALPQRLLIAHGRALGALLGCAVPPVCERRLVLSPQGFDLPLKGSCLLTILTPYSDA